MDLIAFIFLYFVAGYISNYTVLSKYNWFNILHTKILLSEKKYRNLYIKILGFKFFNCKSCNIFWLSLAMGFFINIFLQYNFILVSLVLYLFKKSEEV
jgi:hypothetical protein